MGSLFRTFRVLTWGNLVVQGIFLLLSIAAALNSPSAAFFFAFMCPAIIHNFLCLRLIRKMGIARSPLNLGFKTMVMVTGIYNILIGILLVAAMIANSLDGGLVGRINISNDPNLRLVAMAAYVVVIAIIIHGGTIAANSILSFIYLKNWKKLIIREENTLLTFDAETDPES